jgi:hypothetical protein
VTGTGIPGRLKPGRLGVRLSPPVPMPGRPMAGQRSLESLIEVRVLARQQCLCSSAGESAPLVRERPAVRIRAEALMCSYSKMAREAGPRCRMLRVRIPPSAQRPSDRRPAAPCTSSLPSSTLGKGSGRPAHACLVTTAACLPGTEAVGVRFPGQAPCGCGVVVTHHLAMVKARVRFPVSALEAL